MCILLYGRTIFDFRHRAVSLPATLVKRGVIGSLVGGNAVADLFLLNTSAQECTYVSERLGAVRFVLVLGNLTAKVLS
jgi:hypothetical protein